MKTITIDGIEYNLVPKEKTELDLLKEKYESGDYICIYRDKTMYETKNNWAKITPTFHNQAEYKLIAYKHKDILDAYLADNSVEIAFLYAEQTNSWIEVSNFIDSYKEDNEYRLKQKYPIFKRNEDGEVLRYDSLNSGEFTFVKDWKYVKYETTLLDCNISDWETIPYNNERGLYHLQPVFVFYGNDCSIEFFNLITNYGNSRVQPITPEQLKTMPFIWSMYQEVLKDK